MQSLAAGTDLNTVLTDGYYGVPTSAIAQGLLNNPLSSVVTGIILKVHTTGNIVYQEITGILSGGIYKRRKNDSSFSPWIQMATTSDNVASATKLQTGRTLKVNLARTSASTAFNGTANITNIGVSGTLPIANGGTGATTATAALANLGGLSLDPDDTPEDGVIVLSNTELFNGMSYDEVKQDIVNDMPTASNIIPKANGIASVGTETSKFARGDHIHPLQINVSGNAGTATKLETARTISLTGDVTGSASFDGSANASITATVVNNSHSHSNYTPYETKTATTAATAGWYRIATTREGIGNNTALFTIVGAVAGAHTTAIISAGTSYGHSISNHINVLQCSHYVTAAIEKVRIVYHTTYSGNYAYLEVYNPQAKDVVITVQMTNGAGWSLVAPNTVGSIPSGYSNKEVALSNATISAQYFAGSGASLTSLNASNISSGTLPIARGGTGATTAANARSALGITPANIGAAAASHTHSYLPLSGGALTGSIHIGNGQDLYLKASGTGSGADPGDIVFANADGTELCRIWMDANNRKLLTRTNAGSAYPVMHSGMFSLSGTTLTITT